MTSDDFPRHSPRHTPTAFASFLATLALLAALAALNTGCSTAAPMAQAPVQSQVSAPAPAADCAAVQRDIAQATQELQAARERQSNAWKVVVPFAVLARHAQAGADAEAAERRLAELRARALKEGCGDGS